MAITTFPHGPLTQLASNLWVVTAPTSQGLDRKMSVARGRDGALLLYDDLWLDEPTFAQLDALGPVAVIFVPSYLHDFDGERFAQRYPKARLCGSRATVQKLRWKGMVEFEPSMAPAGVVVEPIPGVARAEMVGRVQHPEGGESLVFSDALFNIPREKAGLITRLMGSAGPLHMSPLGRLFLLKDRKAFHEYLEAQSRRDDLRHLVVGHGEVISKDVNLALAGAAARL
ncbi:MAG: hypothetical protein QM765_16555 [Myxococcales bacterium]